MVIAIITAALVIALAWSLSVLGREYEWHHGYYGIVLICIPVPWIQYMGLYLLLDDDMQHVWEAIMLLWKHKVVSDFTPVHWVGVGVGLLIDKAVGKDVF